VRPSERTFSLAVCVGLVACTGLPTAVTPGVASAPACPIGGCQGTSPSPPSAASPSFACFGEGEPACLASSAEECTRRALAAWSDAQDDRAVACIAERLDAACSLGDAHACYFVARLRLDGHGVERDIERGIAMLERACDDGVAVACTTGARWLSEPPQAGRFPDAAGLSARLETERACLAGQRTQCFQVGLGFYFGREGFPRDLGRAAQAYRRGCDLGDAAACNNLADALAYGDGVERDVVRSASLYGRACRLGQALGCANSGQMFENGLGVFRDRARARELYQTACMSGDVYGCLHAEMLAAQDAGAPREAQRALAHWRRACARGSAKACAFVGIMYEDGTDSMARDADKSLEAMKRACGLGDERGCEWLREHP
jgi:uncharacterized protein